jgi:hypothetical protein
MRKSRERIFIFEKRNPGYAIISEEFRAQERGIRFAILFSKHEQTKYEELT